MKFFYIFLFLFLFSCTPTTSNYYSGVDVSKKIISMPVTNKLLGSDIKNLFRSKGWKVIILDTGSVKTTGTGGQNTNLKTDFKSKARYITYLRQNWKDWCGVKNDMVSFDLSIVDSKSGEEVFVASGEDCQKKIIKDLEEQLSKFWN